MKDALGFLQLDNTDSCQPDINQNAKVVDRLQAHDQADLDYRTQHFNMMDGKYSKFIATEMAKYYVVFGGPYVNCCYFIVDDKSQWKEVSYTEGLICCGRDFFGLN